MDEEVSGQPAEAGQGGASSQAAILDVLIRGLQNAKARAEGVGDDPDSVMKTCIIIYHE